MSAPNQTIGAYLDSRLKDSATKGLNQFQSLGFTSTGTIIGYTGDNYIATASTVKEAILSLDLNLYSVATTYATLNQFNSTMTGVKNGPPDVLSTLRQIGLSLNDDGNFAVNYVSTITGEYVNASNAEAQLTTDLSGEIVRASLSQAQLTSDLSDEQTRASLAELQIRTDLSGEIVRAVEAETLLLSTIQTAISVRAADIMTAGLDIGDVLTDLSDKMIVDISGEANRAILAENAFQTDLSGEILRSITEDISYRTDLSGEIQRASLAQLQLRTDLSGEILRATAAESALDTRIDTVEDYYIPKDPLTKGATGNFDLSGHKIVNLAAPSSDSDAVNKKYVDDSISILGDVFSYRGEVNLSQSNDLTILEHKEKGSAYKIVGNGDVITNFLQQNGNPDPNGYSAVMNKEQPGIVTFNVNAPLDSIVRLSGFNSMNLSGENSWNVVDFTPGTQGAPVDISKRDILTDYSNVNIHYKFTQNGYVTIYQVNTQTGQWELSTLQVFQNDLLQVTVVEYETNPDYSYKTKTVDGVEYFIGKIGYQPQFTTKRAGTTLTAASNATDGANLSIADYTLAPGQYYREYTAGYFKYAPLEVIQQYQLNSSYFYPMNKSGDSVSVQLTPVLKSSVLTFDISSSTSSSPFVCDSLEAIQAINTLTGHGGQGVLDFIKFSSQGYIQFRSSYYVDANSGYNFMTDQYVNQQVNAGDCFAFFSVGSDTTSWNGAFNFYKNYPATNQPTSTITSTPTFLYSAPPADGLFLANVNQTGYAGFFNSIVNLSQSMYVKNADIVVSTVDGWDIVNNNDITLSEIPARTSVTGSALNGYTVDISSTYVGQTSIQTLGTVSEGVWQATTLATTKGGSGQTSYAKGDVLLGNDATSLDKLTVGSNGTFLKSDGSNASWVPQDTENISLTSATNFPTLATTQEAIDFIFTSYQKRKVIQYVVQDSTQYSDSNATNANLLSGKINFITYNASNTTIYLPSSNVSDGTIVRLVHNGDFSSENLIVASGNTNIVEITPHDSTAFVYNTDSSSWLFGVGI